MISVAGQLMFCNLELRNKLEGLRLLLHVSTSMYHPSDNLMQQLFQNIVFISG